MVVQKCKIFTKGSRDHYDELEKEVNEWLTNNSVIDIVDRQMKTVAGVNELGQTFVNLTIVLFYKATAGDQ